MSDTITIDQIKEAAGKNAELKSGIISSFKSDFIGGAEKEGMIIRTKEQDTQHLESQLNLLLPGKVDEKFNEKFKTSLDAMDVEIKTLTGIDKNANEKTTDYAKRAFKEFHSKGGDPITKQKVTELESMLAKQKTEFETQLNDANSKLFNKEIEWQVNGALGGVNIALPVHLKTDEEKQAFIQQQKNLIKQGFLSGFVAKKDEQGNIIFYEGDKPQMNSKDGKPKTATDLINEKFSAWFVPATHTATGSGTGSGSGGAIPAGGFTKKEQVHEYLRAQGIEAGSKEYLDQLDKLCKDAKLDI